LILANTL